MTWLRPILPGALAVVLPVLIGALLADRTELLEVVAALLLALVVLIALLGGRWPAVLGAVVSALVLNYWFTDPVHTLKVAQLNDVLVLGIFTVTALLVSAVLDHVVRREIAGASTVMPTEQPAVREDVIEVGDLRIDFDRCQVSKGDEPVPLTPTEWAFLAVLARSPGRLVSREQLLHDVWGPAYAKETHYLRVYAGQLRRKLEDDPSHPRHLVTTTGRGYTLEP